MCTSGSQAFLFPFQTSRSTDAFGHAAVPPARPGIVGYLSHLTWGPKAKHFKASKTERQ